MAVKYVTYGKNHCQVSRRWATVFKAADRAGVGFTLNSGHRTMAEQAALYSQNMSGGRPKPGHPLTAVPNANAPHIAVGRSNHANDINATDGGEARLQRFLERHGARVLNPVNGEPWHQQVSQGDLRRLSRKLWSRYRSKKWKKRRKGKKKSKARKKGK